MSQNNERRDFFRIEDEVSMELTPYHGDDALPSLAQLNENLPESFLTLNQLRKLDNDNKQLLRNIQDKHRDIAQYLKVQNDKLEIFARLIISQLSGGFVNRVVNISGNGLAFDYEQELAVDTLCVLTLMLQPDCYGFACIAKVIKCEADKGRYRIALEFKDIKTADQDELVRHITRLQSQQLRKERLGY